MRSYTQIEAFIFKIINEPEYLILKRIPEKGGFWQPVTGGVKLHESESIESALYREIF